MNKEPERLAVVPTRDLKEHNDYSMLCWCKPHWEIENGHIIIVHNSADHRELYETDFNKSSN